MTYLTIARSYLGTKELKGSADNPKIMEMYRTIGQAARDRAIRHSGEIRNDVQNSSDPALDRRLGRWMRD